MKKNKLKKVFCGVLGTAMLCSMLPSVYAVDVPVDRTVFVSDFEDGKDVSEFTGRGGVEKIEIVTNSAHSGTSSMRVSGREKNWNGPQFLLDNKCKAGVEYTVSAWVRTEWYNQINLSMEYTDTAGERHYTNLKSVVSQGEWVEIPETKLSFSEDVKNVYVYFECNDKADIYVDDFALLVAPVHQIESDIPSLKELYSPYFKIGTAVTTSELAPQSTKDLIDKHFNSITLGNELKPDAILDRNASIAAGNDNPQVNLASAKSILNYCRDNKIPVRGHVLVWHSQTPDWFFKENYADDGEWLSKDAMLVRMENYIKNVFEAIEKEYSDVDFYAWDVVNEIWLDDGNPRQPGEQGSSGSNNSAWVKIFGDNSFVDYAFEYARKYAPEGCKLYYNDFNEYMPQKTDAIVAMANRLKEKGLIDGIGMQSHLDVNFPGVSAYKKALAKFAETGLDIQVTELDATTSDKSEAGFETQAKYYSDIMDAIMEYKDSISAVVFWGTTDDKSWRASKSPLLFNEDYTAKPAFYSIIDGLDVPDTTTSTVAPTTEASTTETTVVSSEEPTKSEGVLYGDANDDGVVDVADVVAVASYVGDNENNKLGEKGLKNADVHAVGNGITADDALAVQQYLAKIVTSLPVGE
ncbi:MAG: endo-1,4-beta-xylanase [Oscillospiraceae bacterium]|nr:endo-1,4-beta-xylanase [Oscillospiraceae bacterium]